MNTDASLRKALLASLAEGGAHIGFAAAVKDFPAGLRGRRVPGIPHTAWHLVYHLWIAQNDILEYIRVPGHPSPAYPSGYWPKEDEPADGREWERKVREFDRDLKALCALVRDPGEDLFRPRPEGGDGSLARAALLAMDHNAYHIGQLIDLRMLLGVAVRDW
jgi:hypothetical protein